MKLATVAMLVIALTGCCATRKYDQPESLGAEIEVMEVSEPGVMRSNTTTFKAYAVRMPAGIPPPEGPQHCFSEYYGWPDGWVVMRRLPSGVRRGYGPTVSEAARNAGLIVVGGAVVGNMNGTGPGGNYD